MAPLRVIRRNWLLALLVAVLLVAYGATLCPTVFVEGTGENIVCAWTLGVPHPPGFPLYCLLSKIFAVALPVGDIAYRINLFSAVMGAFACGALFHLLLAVGIGRFAAAAAALTFAFSATFWRQATIAEVYTLSMSLIALQIIFLLRWRRERGREDRRATPPADDRYVFWFALTFGLGLAVHYSHILLIPAYAVFIYATDPGLLRRPHALLGSTLLVIAGFSIHTYAPIRSATNPPIDWGNPETLGNWWAYLTASQYRGRMFALTVTEVYRNAISFLRGLPTELTWPGLVLALGGAVAMLKRDRPLFWLTGLTISSFIAWAINYDIPWEIEVYYLPAILALTFCVAFGLDAAVQWLARRPKLKPLAGLALVMPALAFVTNFARNDLSEQRFVLENTTDILKVIEPQSCIILPSTNPTFALMYQKFVENQAVDVELWSRVEGGVVPTTKAVHPSEERRAISEARFIGESIARGKAVFAVDRVPDSALSGFAQVPWGCLYRIMPAAQKRSTFETAPDPFRHPFDLDISRRRFTYGSEERLIASRYILVRADYAWMRGDEGLSDRLLERTLNIGGELASVVAQVGQRNLEQGRTEDAARVYDQALQTAPDALLHVRLGSIYGRTNRLELAQEQFEKALTIDPTNADAHANLASVYGRRGDIEAAVRELETALVYEPNNILALKNLGFAYAQMGRFDDARRALEHALEVNPAQKESRDLLNSLPQR